MAKFKWIRLLGFRRKTKEVRNFITVFRDQTIEVVSRELGKGAKQFAEDVRQIILRQKYRWKPLSKRWLRYKEKHGLDPRTHIATKTYVKSIRARPRRRLGRTVSWSVGPGRPNQIHRPSGMRFTELARILEFGSRSRRIPPRPHWRPAWSAFVRRDSKVLSRNAVRAAYKEAIAKARRKRS